MSSLRNAVKRRAHKERAQPVERRRYGLLEKHKDYVQRARDFHSKEDRLKALKLKASFRNPDEFYFKMEHTATRGGVHSTPSSARKFSEEELALMRSQDRGYILTKLQAERKKVERLQASLHGVLQAQEGQAGQEALGQGQGEGHGQGARTADALRRSVAPPHAEEEVGQAAQALLCRKHVHFDEEGRMMPYLGGTSQGQERGGEGTDEVGGEELGMSPRDAEGGAPSDACAPPEIHNHTIDRKVAAAYRELDMRRERVQRLSAVLQEMELQKALTGKGRKGKVAVTGADGETTHVYKWAKQRQR